MRASSTVVLLAALAAAPAPARADKVIVLEFGGDPGGAHAGAPASLSKGMAEAIRETGAEVSEASREDVVTLAGCADASDDCLRQALGILEVNAAVTGEVRAAGGGGVTVELRAVLAGEASRTRTVELSGTSAGALAGPFQPEARAFWLNEPSPAAAAAAAQPSAAAGEGPAGADLSSGTDRPGGRFSASRVQSYSWAIAGSGVGLLAIGSILLIAADGKQGEVDEAPTDTVEELEHLAELEASGRSYARWGNVCVLLGGVAALAGGVLILKQGQGGGSGKSAEVTLAPSGGDGVGAALLVRGGF